MKRFLYILIFSFMFAANASATDQTFTITLRLFAPISITKVQDLLFPDTTITGSAFNVTVTTSDAGAATFNATGTRNRNITRSVVESSVNMTNGDGGTILVDTFTLAGPTRFNNSGIANSLKVGATAHILANTPDGNYTGSATYRVVYQ